MNVLPLRHQTAEELAATEAEARAVLEAGCDLAEQPIEPDQAPRFFRALADLWNLWLSIQAEKRRRRHTLDSA